MSASGSTTSQRGFVTPNSDAKLTASDQAVAGSLAKAATKLALYPLDTWKSRKQARRFGETAEFRHLRTLTGVYRGVVPKLLLYSLYQAVYMSAYISARDALSKGPAPFGDSGLTFVTAAVVAEVAGSVIRLPMEAGIRVYRGGEAPAAAWCLPQQLPCLPGFGNEPQGALPRKLLAANSPARLLLQRMWVAHFRDEQAAVVFRPRFLGLASVRESLAGRLHWYFDGFSDEPI